MLVAMLQSPVHSKCQPLSVIDLDAILAAIADGDEDRNLESIPIGLISRRLSELISLPTRGEVVVLDSEALKTVIGKDRHKYRTKGPVPHSVVVSTVRAWFYYAQTDISFFMDDLSYAGVERLFFEVLFKVDDRTFRSIIANMRGRISESYDQIILPPSISIPDEVIVGKRRFVDAWLTRWLTSYPQGKRTLGTLTTPRGSTSRASLKSITKDK